jgi:uncharacterized membrane protein YagU involved in acid resistance
MTTIGVIALAGLLSGALDIAATSTLVKTQGVALERLYQTIASGALGPSSFKGGKKTAAIGLVLHFFIALVWAALYFAIAQKLPAVHAHPALSGSLYGIVVHLFMSRIVLPLSAAPKRVFSAKAFLSQLIIHILCVGLPIAITISHFTR